jgi:hypothetical protein
MGAVALPGEVAVARGKGDRFVSNLAEIKRRVGRLKELLSGMGERLSGFVQPLKPELQERLKKEGVRLGAGSGISLFGVAVLLVAALYLVAAVILVVNLAFERLWLSALVVVGAMFLFGGITAAVGAGVARSSAKRLQETADQTGKEAVALAREAVEEVQKEVSELQELMRKEAEERRRQLLQALETGKRYAPALLALLFLLWLLRRRRRRRKLLSAGAPVVIREVITEEG